MGAGFFYSLQYLFLVHGRFLKPAISFNRSFYAINKKFLRIGMPLDR